MKFILHVALLLAVSSCASFKEIKPKPPIAGDERGFIELKKEEKLFDLKKGKRYVVRFPRPARPNFYLVLKVGGHESLNSFMTRAFDDGKGVIVKMDDLSADVGPQQVFDTDTNSTTYYWAIDTVRQDMKLALQYRYVPIWRYKIENHFVRLHTLYEANLEDRSFYQGMGTTTTTDGVDYAQKIDALRERTKQVRSVREELTDIENVFPPDIRGSSDTAYQKYVVFSADVDEELRFKADDLDVLEVLKLEQDARPDPFAVVRQIPSFMKFLRQPTRHPDVLVNHLRSLIGANLPRIRSSYDDHLMKKNDVLSIPLELAPVESLYVATIGVVQEDFIQTAGFVRLFNEHSAILEASKGELNRIRKEIADAGTWPDNLFYEKLYNAVQNIRLPVKPAYGPYVGHQCVRLLVAEMNNVGTDRTALLGKLERSVVLVREINALKEQGNFGAIVRMLRQNKDLEFLVPHYRDLDDRLIMTYDQRISSALSDKNYGVAESQLKALSLEQDFVDAVTASPRKNTLLGTKEAELWGAIDADSKQRAQTFIDTSKTKTDEIDEMYKSEAFVPVHDMVFTSGPVKELTAKKAALLRTLTLARTEQFPATSVELLYKEFTADQGKRGVTLAHAVAKHGRYYKGKDRKILNLIAECDPQIPKWITVPTQYRKVFVVPTTDKPTGPTSTYVFRLNVQIDSDARFPVFDINIRIPKEVAAKSTTEQWFDQITLNGKVIKAEGRVTIVAPSAANDYEMQITPVQMTKGEDNIVEIRFRNPELKVLEFSCMAQKPLIKKN